MIRFVGNEFRVRNWVIIGMILWQAVAVVGEGGESLYCITRGQWVL